MESKNNRIVKETAIKIAIIALISLLLLIPLSMVRGVIDEREYTEQMVTKEIAASYAGTQVVGGPIFQVTATEWLIKPSVLNYKAEVTTDVLKRSIYRVIVYNSEIEMTGKLPVTEELVHAGKKTIRLDVLDFKGLSEMPQIILDGKALVFEQVNGQLLAQVEFPQQKIAGDEVDFLISLRLKGSQSLMFYPYGSQTTLTINSSYPHPSFQGEFLPETREVRDDGFSATWNVLRMNINSTNDQMGVKFVDPANPYQQATRSVKYGLLIILLVFVAGLLVEYLTHKEIDLVQYTVIGLSLVLFYMLLLSFSEFIIFGWAYLIAAVMTVMALMLYFQAILKHQSAYLMGGFLAAVYAVNYILLQMETFALLAGSLVLFALLSVVMYFTANSNNRKLQQ